MGVCLFVCLCARVLRALCRCCRRRKLRLPQLRRTVPLLPVVLLRMLLVLLRLLLLLCMYAAATAGGKEKNATAAGAGTPLPTAAGAGTPRLFQHTTAVQAPLPPFLPPFLRTQSKASVTKVRGSGCQL